MYTNFISPNPKVSYLQSSFPNISKTSYIGPFSSVIGNVTIGHNVFIACSVTLRADEGAPFYVGDNSNLQDGVVIHGLVNQMVTVNNKNYSVYISEEVSCAHGSMVHGPAYIGKNSFLGFNAIVFNAQLGDGCFLEAGAIVTNGVTVPSGRLVKTGELVNSQSKANQLPVVPKEFVAFAKGVIEVNKELPKAYQQLNKSMNT